MAQMPRLGGARAKSNHPKIRHRAHNGALTSAGREAERYLFSASCLSWVIFDTPTISRKAQS